MKYLLMLTLLLTFFSCSTIQEKKNITKLVPYNAKNHPPLEEEEIYKANDIDSKHVAFGVYDSQNGKMVHSKNIDRTSIPASSAKILTSIAALKVMGPTYRFKTVLKHSGVVRGEILIGDLYLLGSGDPLLTASDVFNMADTLRRHGIKAVKGDFYYDDALFASRSEIDPQQKQHFKYNPGVSPLSVEFNNFHLFWKETNKESEVEIWGVPQFAYWDIVLSDHKIGVEDEFLYNDMDSWKFSNELEHEGKQGLPVKNPALFTANLFAYYCMMMGIAISSPTPKRTPPNLVSLYIHRSPPLVDIVGSFLEYSNNLIGELLLLATATKLRHRPVNLSEATTAVKKFLQGLVPKGTLDSMIMINGSGLSQRYRISPRQMIELLKSLEDTAFIGKSFASLLPTAGLKGTLKKRMRLPETALRVWAKTGTMNYATALAGYLFAQNGKRYIFTIYVTDFEKRQMVDSEEDNDSKIKALEEADDWTTRARQIQNELLRKWSLVPLS
jgi:serine-type D-Ala-D-Ala carboxypeptidase/endopeptidase (penicillin-binding protein 4)